MSASPRRWASFTRNTAARYAHVVTASTPPRIEVGLIQLSDIGDGDPLFDLRIRADQRGRGIGQAAVAWLTEYLFTELPDNTRIEGQTRQGNRAMRAVLESRGYVKEAHYREAWPAPDGTAHDSIGYAILRHDWESGTVTLPTWDD